MKTERRVAKRRTESLRASERDQTPGLDPSLWGKLPKENLLDIFDALPIKEHYKLRRVCKDWHNRASERRRLPAEEQVRVREPFFLLFRRSRHECSPFGTLALNATTGQWIWQPAYVWQSLFNCLCVDKYEIGNLRESFEVDGVLFEVSAYAERRDHPTYMDLFDVHRNHDNRKLYRPNTTYTTYIPHVDAAPGSVLGMMVDDASRAYTLILGSSSMDTLVLDSHTKKWESKPSRLVRNRSPSVSTAPKSCVQFQGKMYLWMDSDEIHVYSSSSDKWSALAVPPRDVSDEDEFRGLGHWAGVLYAVTKNEQGTLSVWNLNMANGQWSEYSQIPGSLFAYLMQPSALLPIAVSHCSGYLLMQVLVNPNAVTTTHLNEFLKQDPTLMMKLGYRFVLFNIVNRRWEMVDMPNSKMWKGYHHNFND